MKTIFLSLLLFLFFSIQNLSAWTSSNEGLCYTMDTLCTLSNLIEYNELEEYYEVLCNIEILENDSLKIFPGETVKFFETSYLRFGFLIYGTMLAIGTEDNPIILGDPNGTLSSGVWWAGIQFFNTSPNGESKLVYCNFRCVTNPVSGRETAIYCANASPLIDHCSFKYMGSGEETGGAAAIGLMEESHPHISFCSFQSIQNGVAIWCNIEWFNDSINGPNPLIYGCNIYGSINGIHYPQCDHDYVVLWGGFLDNCYLKIPGLELADTTLGIPIDTIGDGIKTTTSTCEIIGRFLCVDGVVNPRSNDIITGINENEIDILPTTSQHLILKNCYPNPFENFTTIEFELEKSSSNVSLIVIDSKGNIVKTLINNQPYTTGDYNVKWYGENDAGQKVPYGIYFYKLVSGNSLLVKKAIVVK